MAVTDDETTNPANTPVPPPAPQSPDTLSTGAAELIVQQAIQPTDDAWVTPPPVVLSDGTRLQIYKDGRALLAAFEAIAAATKRICLEVYIFRSDSTGRAFAKLLADKARQGVRVYLIYDSFGSWDSSNEPFEQMKSAGVQMREFHPLWPWDNKFGWRPANRDHRKLLLIDDDIAGLGGLNIGAEYGGSAIIKSEKIQPWRDNGVGMVGPAAKVLYQSFARTWRYLNTGGKMIRAQYIHDVYECEFGCLASVPTVNSPLMPFLHKLFQSARESIDLTMAYFAPDDGLIDELLKARRRGVRVRLMLPGISDMRLLHIAARSFYELLMENGVEVYERQGVMLHAKTMVIDDCTSIIGSTNLDYRSIEYNCEISAVIRNKEFGGQMRALFENDKQFAQRIHLARWRYRPGWDRFMQWAVSRARYLL